MQQCITGVSWQSGPYLNRNSRNDFVSVWYHNGLVIKMCFNLRVWLRILHGLNKHKSPKSQLLDLQSQACVIPWFVHLQESRKKEYRVNFIASWNLQPAIWCLNIRHCQRSHQTKTNLSQRQQILMALNACLWIHTGKFSCNNRSTKGTAQEFGKPKSSLRNHTPNNNSTQ